MPRTMEGELQGLVAYNIGRAKDFAHRINKIGDVDADALTTQDPIDTEGVTLSLNGYLGTINLAVDVIRTQSRNTLSDVTGIDAHDHLQEFFASHRSSSIELRSSLADVDPDMTDTVIIVPNIDTKRGRFHFNLARLPDPVIDHYTDTSYEAYVDTDRCPSVPLSELCLEYADSVRQWESETVSQAGESLTSSS